VGISDFIERERLRRDLQPWRTLVWEALVSLNFCASLWFLEVLRPFRSNGTSIEWPPDSQPTPETVRQIEAWLMTEHLTFDGDLKQAMEDWIARVEEPLAPLAPKLQQIQSLRTLSELVQLLRQAIREAPPSDLKPTEGVSLVKIPLGETQYTKSVRWATSMTRAVCAPRDEAIRLIRIAKRTKRGQLVSSP
jgi:hypothetical protein